MQIAVLVEPMPGNGFRARGGEPFAVAAEGATRDEAVAKWKDQVQARLRAGAEIVTVEVGHQEHPWLKGFGMFKDDPLLDEWKEAMSEYRKKVDESPDELP